MSAALTAVAGCTELPSITGNGTRQLGKSATYEGVEFTPTKYLLTNTATMQYGGRSQKTTAPDGATFILTKVHVVNNGDSAVSFPGNGFGTDGIHVIYDGERLPQAGLAPPQSLSVAGRSLTPYNVIRREKATGDVYPGTEIEGWITNEIAVNFSPSDLELRVIWNNQPFGDGGEVTHTWTYTTDAEIQIEDIETNSTIVI